MTKEDKRWIWYCTYDTWSWTGGVRCYATSKKPTTRQQAIASARKHELVNRHHLCKIRRLGHYERW